MILALPRSAPGIPQVSWVFSHICIFHSPEYEHVIQVLELLPCWSLIRDWCSSNQNYFGGSRAQRCYSVKWEQIPFILFVGQLCHRWFKLCRALCNHFVAIPIQKQTVTKCSLSPSVETLVFWTLYTWWEVANGLYFSSLLIIIKFTHSWENSSLTALCFRSDSLWLLSFS